jgi:hypothetical protein
MRAAEARRAGDRELATAIKAMKRPATSAWLVNLLVRNESAQVEELLALGGAMREAQERLAGDELRRLSQRRRQAVSALGRAARGLASEVGQHTSEATQRELETTLEAALADPAAGDAVRSGRVTVALTPSGLGSLDLAGGVSPTDKATAAPKASRQRVPARSEKHDPGLRTQREALDLELRDAVGVAEAAERHLKEQARQVSDAREEHRRLQLAADDLQAQLEQRRSEAAAASRRLREAERASATAERSATAAERRVDRVLRSLNGLGD